MRRTLTRWFVCLWWLCLVALSNGQQLKNGKYYTPPTILTIPNVITAGTIGGSTTSPNVFGVSPNLNSMVVGVIALGIGTNPVVTSVCDGTGADGCTGSDTFTIEPAFVNGSAFKSWVFFNCNSTAPSANLTISFTGTASFSDVTIHQVGSQFTGSAGGCVGGYNKAQSTSAGTTYTSGTLTTTHGNDLLIGLPSNGCGGSAYTAGVDGQGHTYTMQSSNNGVVGLESFQETTNNIYSASVTGPSCAWNMEILDVIPGTQTGNAINWGSNGRNYQNTQANNGTFYGGRFAATGLVDFHGGTNGVAPTNATLNASTVGTFGTCSGTSCTVNMGGNLQYVNAMATQSLYTPATIGGVNVGGNSGLGLGGTTSGTGTSIGYVVFPLSGSGASTSLGFNLYTDCPGLIGNGTLSQDCGAIAGLNSAAGGGQYALIHYRQRDSLIGLKAAMENQPGGTISYVPILSQTVYRVNVQENSSGNNFLVLCDSQNRFINSWTMTSAAQPSDQIWQGISGEEPTTAGYHYYWWNFVWNSSGTFNLNGPCF